MRLRDRHPVPTARQEGEDGVTSYVSALRHQPRQPLHQVRDEDDVHDVGEVRRPAGEGHQLPAQRLSAGGVDGDLEHNTKGEGHLCADVGDARVQTLPWLPA